MVWPSRKLSRADQRRRPQHARRPRRRRPAGDRADDLAHRPVLLVPLPRRLRRCSRSPRCWSSPPLAHPACRLGPVLGWKPLRWVGVRSYGIYLWHFPIIVLTTPGGIANGAEPLRELLQVGGDPRRRGALLEVRRGAGPPRRDRAPLAARRGGAAGGRGASSRRGLGGRRASVHRAGRRLRRDGRASTRSPPKAKTRGSKKRPPPATTKPPPLTPAQAASSKRSSCKAVVHIGDSTSEGLDLGRIPAAREPADRSPVRRRRRQRSALRDLRRPLDRRAVRRRTERPGSGGSLEGRRLQRLLGAGARHQRRRRRLRRLRRRRARNGSKK